MTHEPIARIFSLTIHPEGAGTICFLLQGRRRIWDITTPFNRFLIVLLCLLEINYVLYIDFKFFLFNGYCVSTVQCVLDATATSRMPHEQANTGSTCV